MKKKYFNLTSNKKLNKFYTIKISNSNHRKIIDIISYIILDKNQLLI